MAACEYVRQNPVRAGLALDWRSWGHAGAAVVGYPNLTPDMEDFWERFWKLYARLRGAPIPVLTRRATGASEGSTVPK